ncbi:MAG: DNA methyltransferase [Terriglobia bacterium]
MQPSLLELPSTDNGLRDSAFAKNRDLPVHRWVPWIAGFSAQFVGDCLTKYFPESRKNDAWILDPFAGVGTTLVEAYAHGHNVIGFEINPYAALAAKVKLQASSVRPKALAAHISGFNTFLKQHSSNGDHNGKPRSVAPIGFAGRRELFSPKVERKMLLALDYINSIGVPAIRDIFRLAFGSVMVSVSNYSYEPSLTRRSAVDKKPILDAAVDEVISAKLNLMLKDMEWLQREKRKLPNSPDWKVYADSFFSAPKKLNRSAFVGLIITSPPYLNNYHYPRNTRPQLHWLGLASGPGYKAARERESFGKFWQTVRDLPPVTLSFHLPELKRVIDAIRSLNGGKGHYGGSGWANYATTYFNDTFRFCEVAARLLPPDGVAVIVLGNSIIQGVEVKTDDFFGRIAELCRLTFEDNVMLRKKRTGSSIIQSSVRVDKAGQKTVLYESAVVLRKK